MRPGPYARYPSQYAPPAGSAHGGGYAGTVLADNPVAYLRLGAADGVTFPDETGGPAGTVQTAASLSPGPSLLPNGQGASTILDTTGSIAVSGNDRLRIGSGSFSVEAWIAWPASSGEPNYWVIAHDGAPNSANAWGLHLQAHHAVQILAGGDDNRDLGSFAPPLTHDGTPHHIALTVQGLQARFYVDGELAQTPSIAHGTVDGDDRLSIGQFGNGWHGPMQELAVYNKALTQAQVAAHHAAAQA